MFHSMLELVGGYEHGIGMPRWELNLVLITEFTRQFKTDFKKYQHKQEIIDSLHEVLTALANEKKLPVKCRDQSLTGNYKGSRECHVKPDVFLVYHVKDKSLIVERIGSHSELF